MEEIRIDFVDFWENMNKTNFYFFKLLSRKYTVIIDSVKPDLIFYSDYGFNYLKYNCKRIYWTGENIRPDFTGFDFGFTFDYNNNKKHYRLPLYSLYIDGLGMSKKINDLKTKQEYVEVWNKKTKFCCMVVSNPRAKFRLDFFEKLSKVKLVDSGGKVLNNIGGPVPDKLAFIQDYKFVLAFENEMQDGYTTEKILEPAFKDCIPIYWGNKSIHLDFNPKRFINYHDFSSEEALINKIIEIDENPEVAVEMLMNPILNQNRIASDLEVELVLSHIESIINSSSKPIAKTIIGKIHYLKTRSKRIPKYLKRKLSLITRNAT
jgi:hypothetical protein